MSVVNVKVAYIRPKYNNLKEWCKDESNVYIGRCGIVFIDGKRYPPKDSPFANPFKIDVKNGKTRDYVLEEYRNLLKLQMQNPLFKKDLLQLKGKNLGCWCSPDKCHGDIILEELNKLSINHP